VSINYSKYNGDADGDPIQAGIQPIENICPPDDDPIPASTNYNTSILYVGANDGMLHAFRDCDGKELWAFIPPNNLAALKYITNPQSDGHPTFVDGAPSVFIHDQNNNGVIEEGGGDKVVLLFGQRRGGGKSPLDDYSRGAYYAIDVTDYTAPKLLWMVDNEHERRYGIDDSTGPAELGETWTQPRLAKIPVDGNSFKILAFVGAGYDNREDLRYGQTQNFPSYADLSEIDINDSETLRGGTVDGLGDPLTSDGSVAAGSAITLSDGTAIQPRGRGILAIEVATLTSTLDPITNITSFTADAVPSAVNTVGKVYWNYTRANGSNTNLLYSFPSDLAVLDVDSNGYSDRIYVGDTGGNMWRFDIEGATTSNWGGKIIFRSNPSTGTDVGRKIFYRPQVAFIGGYPRLYFGTGDREHPLNRAVIDRMYSVADYSDFNDTYNENIGESYLVDVTLNNLQEVAAAFDVDVLDNTNSAIQTYNQLYTRPGTNAKDAAEDPLKFGWFIKMDGTQRGTTTSLGEKILAPATIFSGQVFFSSYQLLYGAVAGCEAGNLGISRLYHLNYLTGEAVLNYDVGNDTTLPDNTRGLTEDGKVLARSDRVRTLGEGIPSGIVTIVDASGRVTMLISSSDKVEATGLPDVKLITPVYWMQW